jgi:hypothetical protein
MQTQQPVLELPDGTRLSGIFEETVGTQLILADALGSSGHQVRLVGHTDKRICFKAPAPADTGSPGDLLEAAAAASAEGGTS